MNMELWEFLLLFTMLWSTSSAVRCYKCDPKRNDYGPYALCEQFDHSEKYVVDCVDSTVCYKKVVTSSLGNGIKLYERGCAKQVLPGEQQRINDKWVYVNIIHEESYTEGCAMAPEDEKVTKTLNCFCRGDLCNGGLATRGALALVVGLLIFNLIQ